MLLYQDYFIDPCNFDPIVQLMSNYKRIYHYYEEQVQFNNERMTQPIGITTARLLPQLLQFCNIGYLFHSITTGSYMRE